MGSPTRAAVYLRISLDRANDGLAVERQREDCEQIIKQRGWILTETYVDNSVSAFNRSKVRPAYNQMVSDYEAGLFDAIVCWDLDRLTRQPRQLEDWIDLATDRGLILVTANGEADLTTDGGRMYARIKASVARAEMERKGARQTRALQQRAQKGVAPKGQRLYGYTTSGDLVASESDVVRQLFVDFSQGVSLFALAKKLNEAGTPTLKGGRWIPSTIRGMLTNPRYAARAVYKNVVLDTPANWPAAIDEGTFDLVQSILNDPRRVKNREGTQRKHLGSGLYVCGICGTPLRTNGSRYWCHSGGHLIRSMQPVDDYVMAVVAARLAAPDFEAIASKRKDDAAGDDIAEQARQLQARLDAVGNDYDSGLIDGKRYQIATAKIQAELDLLDSERARLIGGNALASLTASGESLEVALLTADLGIIRAVLNELVTVRLLPGQRGVKKFDPATVVIDWKAGDGND